MRIVRAVDGRVRGRLGFDVGDVGSFSLLPIDPIASGRTSQPISDRSISNEGVAKIIPTNHRKRLRAGGVKVEAERPVVAADPAKDAPPASGA